MDSAMARIDQVPDLPNAGSAFEAEPRLLARAPSAVASVALSALPIVVLGIAWELFARSGAVTMFQLPPLSAVFERIWHDASAGDLFLNTGLTLYRAIAGFLIATVAGVGLGMLMSRSAIIRWFFDPIISVGFPMPKIAFLPIIVLWLGFYDVSKISIVVFDAIFPVVTATIAGIAGIERQLIWSARNMGANERELMWQIALPAALPQIFTGLQVALPIAMIVAVVAEMVMGGYGLGGAMMTSYRFAESRGVFAGIVEIAVVGYVLVKGMALLRRRLLIWHPEASEPTTV
jgi:ABC-type nitrate/sulfonate/bicarbonate transport system permease component